MSLSIDITNSLLTSHTTKLSIKIRSPDRRRVELKLYVDSSSVASSSVLLDATEHKISGPATTHSFRLARGLNEYKLVEWGTANSYVRVTLESQTPEAQDSDTKSVQVSA